MKKSFLCLFLVFAMILSACSSSDEPTEQAAPSVKVEEKKDADVTSEASKEDVGNTEGSAAAVNTGSKKSGFSLKVNGKDGKLTVSRAIGASKKMGSDGVWTIFVYLCGTDLESGQGSATSDVAQMMESSGSDNVRFIIQTGGTSEWYNEMFAVGKAERYIVQNGDIELLDTVELTNMGESSTLESFLRWGVTNYASEKMGLVFWDHGGGSITGVCVDELFNNDTLYLSEINSALSSVYNDVMTDKFEFIGFDCCLMGTAETANILATYARYMYGSQETEPGSGWDYTAISDFIVSNPSADGAALGKALADSFYEECKQVGQENECTMTVVDLSKFDAFLVDFNDYAARLYEACSNSDALGAIVRCIDKVENFGGNNKSEGYTNMVDIGGIVNACADYADPGNVLSSLKNCITYNKNGSNHRNASGLSVYYPLQIQGSEELKVFSGIAISPYYMSIADMVATGYTDNGYSNTVFFTDDGDWSNEDCEYDYFDDDYFDYYNEDDENMSSLITFEEEPSISEDGQTYGFILDENGREWTSSVDAYLMLNINDETRVELGETADVFGDFGTGEFYDGFDGWWYSLPDEQLLATYLVGYADDGETAVYTSPVYVNGKRTNLRFTQNDITLKVEGTWDGIGENGMAAREIKKIKQGDVIVPIYYLDDDSEFEGDEYEWEEEDELIFAILPSADYFYEFTITDAYGDYYYSDYVVITVTDDGEIIYSYPEEYYSDEYYGDDDYGFDDGYDY